MENLIIKYKQKISLIDDKVAEYDENIKLITKGINDSGGIQYNEKCYNSLRERKNIIDVRDIILAERLIYINFIIELGDDY